MMIDFGLISYFLSRSKKSSFDVFMGDLDHILVMHKHHLETTTALYRKEYEQAQIALKDKYVPYKQHAAKVYKETYESIKGSEDERDAYAYHEAGYQQLEHEEQNEYEYLSYRFRAMADYFNKSSLVITYAICENQLRRYSQMLTEHLKKRITLEDFEKSDYLESMFNYLDKVIEIELGSLHPLKSRLKDLQYLRNRIMHNGGEFLPVKNEELDRIIGSSDDLLELSHDSIPYDEFAEEPPEPPQFKLLKIKKVEYLDRYIKCIRSLFEGLFWQTDKRLNHEIFTNRLIYINGWLADDLKITEVSGATVKKGYQIKAKMISAESQETVPGNITITMLKAAKNTLSITDQFEKSEKLTRLIAYVTKRPEIINNEFLQGFNLTHTPCEVSILYH